MAASDGRTRQGARRVLVVDDNADIRLLLRMTLGFDYDVDECADATEAMAKIRSGERFDLVITDVLQPGMNGLDFTERIHRDVPGLPVVVLSAWINKQNAQLALDAGASAAIAKPFGPVELMRTLTGLLA